MPMPSSVANAVTDQPERSVARPIANLGNTCYMNATLQCLSHAPELLLAIDVAPHQETCPVYARRLASGDVASRSSSPQIGSLNGKVATRKSRRSGGRKSPPQQHNNDIAAAETSTTDSANNDGSNNANKNGPLHKRVVSGNTVNSNDDVSDFCALCEVEEFLKTVHAMTASNTAGITNEPAVSPVVFVNGFIERVAPWFKLGVQEDSHEFLRLLIDSMQASCKRARSNDDKNAIFATDKVGGTVDEKEQQDRDVEYPFSLFRGTVESNVTCSACGASSFKLDPIEDVGLEVVPTGRGQLVDVQKALERYACAEALDSNYKCEKCNQLGSATKQSRLASVPPILTLHLKRFRYGNDGSNDGTVPLRRSGRSEVAQLLGSPVGASGSSKIEGPMRFDVAFDLQPFLTPERQKEQSNCMCRLFAVVVHAGKNSHSGHYYSYVHSLTKNEWWKMDDGRVTKVGIGEVLSAEAYMLFYRVVRHPIALSLEEQLVNKLDEKNKQSQLAKEESMIVVKDRKRTWPPIFDSGKSWAKAQTRIPEHLYGMLDKIQNWMADEMQLKPDVVKLLMNASSTAKSDSLVQEEDTVDIDMWKRRLKYVMYKLIQEHSDSDEWLCPPPLLVEETSKVKNVKVETASSSNVAGDENTTSPSKKQKTMAVPRVAVVESEMTDLL